ncbi:hypothetical protein [Bacillus mycoides]
MQVVLKLIQRHKDELASDGVKVLSKYGLKHSLEGHKVSLKNEQGRFHIIFEDGQKFTFSNSGNRFFPRRAILRVGMLLRDSAIAKEVRTQLLNIEEKSTKEVKVADVTEELQLQTDVGKAFTTGDINGLLQAATGLMAFKNRHIDMVEAKLKDTELTVKALAKEETSFKSNLNSALCFSLALIGLPLFFLGFYIYLACAFSNLSLASQYALFFLLTNLPEPFFLLTILHIPLIIHNLRII